MIYAKTRHQMGRMFKEIKNILINKCKDIHLVLFVLRQNHDRIFTGHGDRRAIEKLMNFLSHDFSKISALVLTHCDDATEDEIERLEDAFDSDDKLSQYMTKNLHTVGLPSNSIYKAKIDNVSTLHHLIVECGTPVRKSSFLPSILNFFQGPHQKLGHQVKATLSSADYLF